MAFLIPLGLEAAETMIAGGSAIEAIEGIGAGAFSTLESLGGSFEAFAENPSLSSGWDLAKQTYSAGTKAWGVAKSVKRGLDDIESTVEGWVKKRRKVSASTVYGSNRDLGQTYGASYSRPTLYSTGPTSSGVIYDSVMAQGVNLTTGVSSYDAATIVNQSTTTQGNTEPPSETGNNPIVIQPTAAQMTASSQSGIATTGYGTVRPLPSPYQTDQQKQQQQQDAAQRDRNIAQQGGMQTMIAKMSAEKNGVSSFFKAVEQRAEQSLGLGRLLNRIRL